MNAIERRIQDLYNYQPDPTAQADLAQFWETLLRRPAVGEIHAEAQDGVPGMRVKTLSYTGFDDTTLYADLIVPEQASAPLPCVIVFPGYTSGRGLPVQHAPWILAGMAVLAVDVRGQGGQTGNRLGSEHGMTRGWISEGILQRERSYYAALAVDARAAVHAAGMQPEVDASRIGVVGGSQGGGLALLTAAIAPEVKVVLADIPNMCHMDYGLLNTTGSLTELADFCRRFPEHLDTVLRNISYFDMLNLAERVSQPAMLSVGLKDTVCMPEQIFPVFGKLASQTKHLEIYPFAGHEVGPRQRQQGWTFVAEHL